MKTLVAALLIAVVGAAGFAAYSSWAEEDDPEVVPAATESETVSPVEPLEGFGQPVELEVMMQVAMPPELDDGVPERKFTGDGVLDAEADISEVIFRLGKIPNSAGYFGHVPGRMQVVYAGPDFLVTFPILRDVLAGRARWMRYDLPVLTTEYAADLGVGQLREIALADPRLGLALAAAAAETSSPPAGDADATVDIETLAAGMGPDLQDLAEEIRSVGVDSFDVVSEAGSDGPTSVIYKASYLPSEASAPVEIEVSIGFGDPSGPPAVPDEGSILDYREYLNF